jgi:hypothetical protein
MRLRSFRMVPGLLLLVTCAAIVALPSRSLAQGPDVSHLVPAQVSFATEFAQHLSNAGWSVQRVSLSIYNGGYFGPTKAVWIKTDKGILEVVFFDKAADLDAVQLVEEESGTPNYHKYRITLANKVDGMEGRLPVYFTKYQDKLIITYDRKLNEALNLLLE